MSTKKPRKPSEPIRVTMDNVLDVVRWTGKDIWYLCRVIKDAEARGYSVYINGGKTRVLRGIYTVKDNGDDT